MIQKCFTEQLCLETPQNQKQKCLKYYKVLLWLVLSPSKDAARAFEIFPTVFIFFPPHNKLTFNCYTFRKSQCKGLLWLVFKSIFKRINNSHIWMNVNSMLFVCLSQQRNFSIYWASLFTFPNALTAHHSHPAPALVGNLWGPPPAPPLPCAFSMDLACGEAE